jgi:hypothetical protein
VKAVDEFGAAILNKLVAEISGLKLSRFADPRIHVVRYDRETRYNCFIGEELLEHPSKEGG